MMRMEKGEGLWFNGGYPDQNYDDEAVTLYLWIDDCCPWANSDMFSLKVNLFTCKSFEFLSGDLYSSETGTDEHPLLSPQCYYLVHP